MVTQTISQLQRADGVDRGQPRFAHEVFEDLRHYGGVCTIGRLLYKRCLDHYFDLLFLFELDSFSRRREAPRWIFLVVNKTKCVAMQQSIESNEASA